MKVSVVLLTLLIAGVWTTAEEHKPERSLGGLQPTTKTFNPFSLSSWMSLPSRFFQFWFPMFGPNYYPPNLKPTVLKPTTNKPPQNESEKEKPKPETDNIFGVNDKPDDVEELPSANEIEWH